MSPPPDLDVAIVGAGFAGLGLGARLTMQGGRRFRIFEAAADLGGTWRDNHYPGAACDVPSHLYSFSFAPHHGWTRTYAPQGEILAYLHHVADTFGLRRHVRFGCGVVAADFEADRGGWRLTLADGEIVRARVLVGATGGLSRPMIPPLPGLGDFAGPAFHTARWAHDVPLDGARVGVVGTGASAIQVVPAIAPRVGRLHLFQRTPPWILPREDRALGRRRAALFRRLPLLRAAERARIYLGLEWRVVPFVFTPEVMKYPARDALRFLADSVPDPDLRARLTPRYALGCKRVLLSDDYYPALNRSNVELVTDPIDRFDATGVRTADGAHRPLDVLVLATGFHAAEQGAPFPVTGLDGRDLDATWGAHAQAYKGTTVAGFPNLFLLTGPNTGLGHSSMVYMMESQFPYVLAALDHLDAPDVRWLDVRPAAQAAYNRALQRRMKRTVWSTGCDAWYSTADGVNTTLWPGFTFEFRRQLRRFDRAAYATGPG